MTVPLGDGCKFFLSRSFFSACSVWNRWMISVRLRRFMSNAKSQAAFADTTRSEDSLLPR
jgi:hypothetical protein